MLELLPRPSDYFSLTQSITSCESQDTWVPACCLGFPVWENDTFSTLQGSRETLVKGTPWREQIVKSFVWASKNLVSFCKVLLFLDVRLSVEMRILTSSSPFFAWVMLNADKSRELIQLSCYQMFLALSLQLLLDWP